jgi:hypothetical protein
MYRRARRKTVHLPLTRAVASEHPAPLALRVSQFCAELVPFHMLAFLRACTTIAGPTLPFLAAGNAHHTGTEAKDMRAARKPIEVRALPPSRYYLITCSRKSAAGAGEGPAEFPRRYAQYPHRLNATNGAALRPANLPKCC